VAITDVDVTAFRKKVLLLGNWSEEFLGNRMSSSDAMSSGLYSMCRLPVERRLGRDILRNCLQRSIMV
jgi:hypothetical protein